MSKEPRVDVLIHEKIFGWKPVKDYHKPWKIDYWTKGNARTFEPELYTSSLDAAFKIIEAGRGGLDVIEGGCIYINIETVPAGYWIKVEAFTIGDGTPRVLTSGLCPGLENLPYKVCIMALDAIGEPV